MGRTFLSGDEAVSWESYNPLMPALASLPSLDNVTLVAFREV